MECNAVQCGPIHYRRRGKNDDPLPWESFAITLHGSMSKKRGRGGDVVVVPIFPTIYLYPLGPEPSATYHLHPIDRVARRGLISFEIY